MDIFDMFSNTSNMSEVPSIGDIRADFTSISDIANGKADSADWGRGVGAGVGAYFGQPQLGAKVGATVFPILNKAFHGIWDAISK